MHCTIDTLVLGLGNPLRGDDGVAAAVIDWLGQRPLPGGVELLEGGTPGLEIVLMMEGYRRVIVIDAADMGHQPGEWRRFRWDEVALGSGDLHQLGVIHSAGLAEALKLGEALGVLPPELIIYGVQPLDIGWEPGLSEPVEAAIPAVSEAILHELNGLHSAAECEYDGGE